MLCFNNDNVLNNIKIDNIIAKNNFAYDDMIHLVYVDNVEIIQADVYSESFNIPDDIDIAYVDAGH